jgi:hypothetical protein
MKTVLLYIFDILIVGLFIYSKILPYKDKLDPRYKEVFNFFNACFTPILIFLRKFIKPFHAGQGLAVDMAQIVLLVMFLIILNVI